MKKYEAPALVKVAIDPQEAYNAVYPNCVIGEGYDLELGTNCQDEYYPWVDENRYDCYATPIN